MDTNRHNLLAIVDALYDAREALKSMTADRDHWRHAAEDAKAELAAAHKAAETPKQNLACVDLAEGLYASQQVGDCSTFKPSRAGQTWQMNACNSCEEFYGIFRGERYRA